MYCYELSHLNCIIFDIALLYNFLNVYNAFKYIILFYI